MDPKEYELMFQVERSHWWYLGMQSITEALLNRHFGTARELNILDAGCGTGSAMTGFLSKYGTVTGIDISNIALQFCRQRGAHRIARASVEELPFERAEFDLVTSFDVLYESAVIQDQAALTEFARVLARGGCALLRLPAYDWLRGHHDRVIHTARRYTTGRVRLLFAEAGLQIEQISYANTILFPLALLKRTADRLSGRKLNRSDLAIPFGPVNRLFTKVLSFEAQWISRHPLPYGLSVIAIARKVQ